MIRQGWVRWVLKGDIAAQITFAANVFGVVGQAEESIPPRALSFNFETQHFVELR